MAEALGERAGDLAAIVPLPLHRSRLRERGFNQSALLARSVAGHLGVPVVEALERVRPTRSQVGLGRAARKRNVADAFAARGVMRAGLALGLVDDVATSGATLASAAAALHEAGAASVVAVTFALALEGAPR